MSAQHDRRPAEPPPMCEPQGFFQMLFDLAQTEHIGPRGITCEAMTAIRHALAAQPVTSSTQAELEASAQKAERRALMFADILHQYILAMRAALVAASREGSAAGIKWIYNTLAGPGQVPSEDEAALGAQALFNKEMAEHEAFRAAHPSPSLSTAAPQMPAHQAETATFDLVAHLRRQIEFSERTFGPGDRTAGVIDHIRKELIEVQDDSDYGLPTLSEWVDVIILAFDGAWRSGATPEQIAAAIVAKQTKNEGRSWPDWRAAAPGKAIEHDRTGDGS